MIEKLIVLDPSKRLGAGPNNSEYSFQALKNHEFFKGINFENLHKQIPPVHKEMMERFLMHKNLPSIESPVGSEEFSNEDEFSDKEKSLNGTISNFRDSIEEEKFEDDKNEFKLLKEGIIQKKCGWLFYRKRRMILTNQPLLSYYSAVTSEYKV